jgi:acetoin:2,6-dichlorophenolindophenol oxidoreductase subunit alpha
MKIGEQMTNNLELLLSFYRMMVRIRMFEESLIEPILKHEIHTPCHLCSGQEAVPVGLCANLSLNDYLFGNHRSHGHFLSKGGSINALAAEVFCRATGCSRGRGGSMHLIDPDIGMLGSAPIVSGTISMAVGAALASAIRDDGRISVSLFGDGAMGEGVLYESLNFAALKRLPIIFACENNLYATHMPIRECRANKPISRVAEPFGIESFTIDGNDVIQVYDISRSAADICRKGNGPVFLEFLTYRYHGHVGPDDKIQELHTDIRPPEEVSIWREKDPIVRLERSFLDQNLVSLDVIQNIRKEVAREVESAIHFAVNGAKPAKGDLTKYVFA